MDKKAKKAPARVETREKSEEKAASPAQQTPSPEPVKPAKPVPPKPKSLFQLVSEAGNVPGLYELFIAEAGKLTGCGEIPQQYHVFFLYSDEGSINRYTTDRIYTALREVAAKKDRPILLVLLSNGGSVEAAYLISKACDEYARGKFAVAVPRHAKSAATLLALGADEIHMGMMSELGPIDPQVGGVPALALKNALENISQLCEASPKAAPMFSEYLAKTLQITTIGYYERISESAVQYAERLLQKRFKAKARQLATKLVYEYKDHGFVIDHEEAAQLLGAQLVKYETPEYQFAEKVHQFVEEFDLSARIHHQQKVRWVFGSMNRAGIYISSVQ